MAAIKLTAVVVLLSGPHLLALRQPFFLDEQPVLHNVVTFFDQHTVVPVNTSYPALFSYGSAVPIAVNAAVSAALDPGERLATKVGRWYNFHPLLLVWPGRLLSLASLLVAAGIVARLPGLPQEGPLRWLPSFALLASPALLTYGAYCLPDTTVMAFTALSLACSLRLLASPPGDGVLSAPMVLGAAAAGFATASKVNGAVAIVPVVVAVVATIRTGRRGIARSAGRCLICGGVTAVAFLVGSPNWLIATESALRGLFFEVSHAATGHLGGSGVPVLGQIELLLRSDALLVLGAVAGLAVGGSRRPRDWCTPALLVATVLLASVSQKQSLQYLFPMFPAMAVCLTRAASGLIERSPRRGIALVVLACGVNAAIIWAAAAHFLRPSTLDLATEYIHRTVPSGDQVAIDWSYVPRLVDDAEVQRLMSSRLGEIDPAAIRFWLEGRPLYRLDPIRYQSDWLATTETRFIVTSSMCYARFLSPGLFTGIVPESTTPLNREFHRRRAFYQELMSSPRWRRVFDCSTGNGPRVLVFARFDPGASLPPAEGAPQEVVSPLRGSR